MAFFDADKLPPLRGVIPIFVTPFELDGAVSFDQLEREIDFLYSAGVRWAGFGFGSEVARLDPDELAKVVRHAANYSSGRLAIIGNAELTSGRAGTTAVRRVAEAGAQVALVRPSVSPETGPEAAFEAFAEVAEGGGLPIIVQDAPQVTGVVLPAFILARLLTESAGVAAVKVEPTAPARKVSAVVEALGGRPGTIIGGSGGFDYVHELQRGSSGTMPGPAYPEPFQLAAAQLARGDRLHALETHARVLPLVALGSRNMDTFLVVQKHILRRRGVLREPVLRAPFVPVGPELMHEVDELLDDLQLLAFFDDCAMELRSLETKDV